MVEETRKSDFSLDEWLKERKKITNEQRIRCEAYSKSVPEHTQWVYTWLNSLYSEINVIYQALEYLDMHAKLIDKDTSFLMKVALGLDAKASDKDVVKRAKEFGRFVDIVIEKGKNWEAEEKLRKDLQ